MREKNFNRDLYDDEDAEYRKKVEQNREKRTHKWQKQKKVLQKDKEGVIKILPDKWE